MAKAKGGAKKTLTKSAFVGAIAEKNGLSKKQVEGVLDSIVDTIKDQLGGKGPGKFVFPGLARFSLIKVKAKKGGEEKTNPLNGQKYITKDKPAYNKVNIRPIKAIKADLA